MPNMSGDRQLRESHVPICRRAVVLQQGAELLCIDVSLKQMAKRYFEALARRRIWDCRRFRDKVRDMAGTQPRTDPRSERVSQVIVQHLAVRETHK